ncbi:MAG TPA: benzoyl-CoA 2,3-epoxidase subunit BoxA [Methylomirabilota bacterium]|jgi:benzoyl-CoA 2,3-epoxidase subunit A|nr:benzoyl-CoA 2,3-epoxidase subunit BoxA [Methylomirabilota bacterium]
MTAPGSGVLRQHLIDPEICIRCNTCEATCPIGAITHDERNYVVKPDVCNACMACVPPCPTGAIDNWRSVPAARSYSIEAQLGWDQLPPELTAGELAPSSDAAEPVLPAPAIGTITDRADADAAPGSYGSVTPPWSAAHPYTNLYGPKNPVTARVVGNVRVNEAGTDNETHHIVLDFGAMPFPVLEGQSIGIIPPGTDGSGRPHHARQYSVASPRNGERAGYNNLSLTVKRVTEDRQGQPVHGVCSNYLCDVAVGESVQVIGPFGASFLMPNHPGSHIVMICTGTGSAPMRGMTEWRRRLRAKGTFESGRLMLFFGARTKEELPYFGPLMSLPKDFIDINLAFSRTPGQPKRYVQDAMRERAAELAPLLKDGQSYFYLCGVKGMEDGVLVTLREIAEAAGLDWQALARALKREARLHIETY